MNTQPETSKKDMRVFKGISINPGRVLAQVCLFSVGRQKLVPEYLLENSGEIEREVGRFNGARAQCTQDLDRVAAEVQTSIGQAEAEIFAVQKHIMNDPKVVEGITHLISVERKNAEWSIAKVLNGFEEAMASLDNQYLRERSGDIVEIRRRLLNKLSNEKAGFACEGQAHCRRGMERIIAAEELTPNMIVNMKMDKVLGFVTEHGGITSHAAILARSLGVPAVSGLEKIMEHVSCSDSILINGDTGEVFLHPDQATIAALIRAVPKQEEARLTVSPPGTEVAANASSLEDVKKARIANADGIGLFRTEILFVGAERLLTEDEQYSFYSNIAAGMPDRPITFRMLDIGGDKPLPFLRLKKEANPFLGWRGARFLLGNPSIFNSQVRALGRLSSNRMVRILFPMIIDAAQMQKLLDRATEALSGVGHDASNIKFGAMFEVPSAFLQAREIMKKVDFSSIGSNDLIQYLFAIDRDNEMVSEDYNPEHPALWTFLADLAATAKAQRKPLSICGEMAGREGTPSRLFKTGITSLSVSPSLIGRVRSELFACARPAARKAGRKKSP